MQEDQNKNFLWEYLFIWVVTLVSSIISFLCYNLKVEIMFVTFLVILICVIPLWKKQLSKKILYLLDMLNLLGAIVLGYLITLLFADSTGSMIGFVCGVAIMDVFSFTKAGKNTLNAKLANQTNTLARLSICLPIPKKQGLQPIIGVGDLVYYSLLMMYSLKSNTLPNGWTVFLLILVGQLINILFISIFKHRHWYKGFPATLFPGVLFVIAVIGKL
jgi:hypothetical protein